MRPHPVRPARVRQRLGRLHQTRYKLARYTAADPATGFGHPAQRERQAPEQVLAEECSKWS